MSHLFFLAIISILSIYIHIQFLRDYWQIWTYQLKYWYMLSIFLQTFFIPTFFGYITLAIYNKQSKIEKNHIKYQSINILTLFF